MEKIYLDMFSLYSWLNNSLGKDHYLSNDDLAVIEKNVKNYINTGDDSDSNGGDAGDFSITISDVGYASKIIALLYKIQKKCKNSGQKRKLSNLINALKESLEKTKEQINEKPIISEVEPLKQSSFDFFAQDNSHNDEMARKAESYSLFAFNKSLNKDYFPTKAVTIDTSKLNHLSRNELIEHFKAENFYKLSESQVLTLLQAVSNDFLNQYGVKNCAVETKDLKFTNKSIVFGEYDPNRGSIAINQNFIDVFETAKASGDQYYPYQLLATLIHESRHRVQFSKLNQDAYQDKDKAVLDALRKPNSSSYSEYLSAADELDARNAALEYLREMAIETNNQTLKQFYNQKKQEEIDKPKNAVSKATESYFRDIYDGKLMETQGPQLLSKNKFRNVLIAAQSEQKCL